MKIIAALSFALLLLLPGQSGAAEQPAETKANFSIDIPKGWIHYGTQAPKYMPDSVKKAFDAVDIAQPELYLVGWKEDRGRFVAAFAVTYIPEGMATFTDKVLQGAPSEREVTGMAFSNLEAKKIRKGYTARGQKVLESSVDFLQAEKMLVALSDAMVDAGGVKRLRAATYYFRGDAMVGVITLRNADAPEDVVADLDALPTSVDWNN